MSGYDSDTQLSLDSRKLRKLFDEDETGEESEEASHSMQDEYSQGFRRLKKMGLDENMWSE